MTAVVEGQATEPIYPIEATVIVAAAVGSLFVTLEREHGLTMTDEAKTSLYLALRVPLLAEVTQALTQRVQ
jgi:hypothetical protein